MPLNSDEINTRISRSTRGWTQCLVPGCDQKSIHARGSQVAEFERDSRVSLPICVTHAAVMARSIGGHTHSHTMQDAIKLTEADSRTRAQALKAQARERQMASEVGLIYFCRVGDLIKVGWSNDLAKRLKAHTAAAELIVHYPGTKTDETNLHRQLKPALVKGREWFRDCDIVWMFANAALAKHGPPTIKARWTEHKDATSAPSRAHKFT